MNKQEILQQAISTYGAKAQEMMLLEEMSELQKEICKRWRGWDNTRAIAEEIADVEIMLDQIKMIHCCAGRVRAIRASKIRRLEERIREHTASRGPHPAQAPPSPCGGKAKGAEP